MKKYSLLLFVLLLSIGSLFAPMTLSAEEPEEKDKSNSRQSGIKMYFLFGVNDEGTSNQLKGILETSGFHSVQSFLGTATYPLTTTDGLPWTAKFEFPLAKSFFWGIMMSNSLLNETTGSSGFFGANLTFIYSAFTVAPTIHYYFFNDIFYCGINPSLNIISFEESGNKSQLQTYGAVTDLGINIPITTSILLTLTAQYRFIGKMTVGPFQSSYTWGTATPNPVTTTLTFPQSEISFDHSFFGIGIGLH